MKTNMLVPSEPPRYKEEEVRRETLEYFDGDELATDVFIKKYALRDSAGNLLEKTPDDLHRRLAKEFARIEAKYPNPLSEQEIYEHLKGFKRIIPQGSILAGAGNDFQIMSLSNCFVIDLYDSYAGILHADQELVHIYRRRGGCGLSLDSLRPCGSPTKNAAKFSSGIIPFMKRFSNTTREVATNGRRGAQMQTLSIHHPQIEDFIDAKRDLKKITGANLSVMITDEFMNAVKEGKKYQQRFPVKEKKNPKIEKWIDAGYIWDKIIDSAWTMAEPGILYADTINEGPADIYYPSISTNPCSEIPLSARSSCKLLLINSTTYVRNPFTNESFFDFEQFEKDAYVAQKLMDDVVDLEAEQANKIINKVKSDPEPEEIKRVEIDLWNGILKDCVEGRRTGLGLTGIGDTLAYLGLRYGSDESIKITEKIYKTLAIGAYKSTIDMSQHRGQFKLWEYNKEKDHKFLNRIVSCLSVEYQEKYKKYGRRNVALLTSAPCGSISCLTRTTSGIEPAYLLKYTRRRKINPEDTSTKVDFVDDVGDSWQEYDVYHRGFKEWMKISGKSKIEDSPYHKATSNDIEWEKGVDIQSAAQKWICHAISRTCNIPEDSSKELVSKIYMSAYEKGCKGFTVYRDKCRSGVLISKDEEKKQSGFQHTDAPKRPEKLPCDIHQIKVKGENWTILVGLYDNKPYEIFGGLSKYIEIPKKYDKGIVVKNYYKTKNNTYDLIIGENGNEFKIKDVVSVFDNPNFASLTRMLSLSLRHGAKINYIVDQLLKDKDADLFSFSRSVSRVLKNYIADGEKSRVDKTCPECQNPDMIYQEGCVRCPKCSWTRCS